MSFASQITGLPMHKPKTRRGRGKGKPAGSSKTHLANLTAAHAKGDHAAVKSHAFALIRSLPQPAMQQADEQDPASSAGGAIPPTASAASPPAVSGPPMKPPSGGGLSALAGLLTARKGRT